MIADGLKSDHLVGYLRGKHVAVIVPRWPLRLGGRWAATTIEVPPGKWSNVLTRETVAGGRLRVQSLLQRFPVALLTREAT
jgi:(1->4)-alpha-D-glucan 1-alpha-D-glucosylmutase